MSIPTTATNGCEMMFDDDDEILLAAAVEAENEINARDSDSKRMKATAKTASTRHELHQKFGRHEVVEVIPSPHEVTLQLKSTWDNSSAACSLRGFWKDTNVRKGAIVHVLADFGDGNTAVIDDDGGFIVVVPDHLVSGTSVVSALFCMRKTIFGEWFRGFESGNLNMVIGMLVHRLFQEVVTNNISANQHVKLLKNILQASDMLHSIYGLEENISTEHILAESMPFLNEMSTWMQTYVSSAGPLTTATNTRGKTNLQVVGVHDIEENLWVPRLGLKGKVDITVEVKLHRRRVESNDNVQQRHVLPLELKTGRPSFSEDHKGQTTLYTMMMASRSNPPPSGLLLYLRNGEMREISQSHAVEAGLIQLRNRLVVHLDEPVNLVSANGDGSNDEHPKEYKLAELPEPIDHPFCGKCCHLTVCSMFSRDAEKKTFEPNHAMAKLSKTSVAHLTQDHIKYFLHWCTNLFVENLVQKSVSSTWDMWCTSSWERELKGRCFSGMVLSRRAGNLADGASYEFVRREDHPSLKDVKDVGLTIGEYVVVSDEASEAFALATGTIVAVTKSSVQVFLDRDLFKQSGWETRLFRIDCSTSLSPLTTSLSSLARLMVNRPSTAKLRDIVIGRKPPSFLPGLGKETILKVKEIFKPLNRVQRRAIMQALAAKEYMLIKGFPGSGKTSTIVALIEILNAFGHSVLLTSYTHSAVDNVMLKLRIRGVDFLRLGQASRLHPDLQQYSAVHLTKNIKSLEELATFYNSKMVVGVTCLGCNHAMLTKRKFDVCIVDEASQILQSACLAPLFHCRKFILVGDPKQLPPVIQSDDARERGMEETLFSRLDTPQATSELNLQYRMNGEITRLANDLTYGTSLECASDVIKNATLQLTGLSTVREILDVNEARWLRAALSSDLHQSVLFLDTDDVPAKESLRHGQWINAVEAELTCFLATILRRVGLAESSFGIISPYKNQVQYLRKHLTCLKLNDVEVSTVDQYQGRDKEVIIVSCARSGEWWSVPREILHDIRRLNVSITRAKKKLLLIGSQKTLQQYEPFKKVFASLRPNQRYTLPVGADEWCRRCLLNLEPV